MDSSGPTKLDCDQLKSTRDQLDNSGLCCGQLDHIDWIKPKYDSDNYLSDEPNTENDVPITADNDTKSAVLPAGWNEVARVHNSPSSSYKDVQSHPDTNEPKYTKDNSASRRRPNIIAVETKKPTVEPVAGSGDIVPMPQAVVHANRDFGTIASKLYPEVPNVVPATGTNVTYNEDATIEQYPSDDRKGQMTTITKLPTDPIVNRKPALLGVPVIVAEEVNTKDTTNEQYLYDIKSDTKTTSVELPMEFLEVSRTSLTRGFLEMAEEARHVCVRSEQCFMVDADLSQVTGTTNPVCDPSPWSLGEELRQYIRVKQEGALRATRERDELRQMQWPDIKSDDMVMDGWSRRCFRSVLYGARLSR